MVAKSFREIYESIDKRPSMPTPRKEFMERSAKLTKRKVFTVRMWCQGRQVPDALAQSVISDNLGIPVDVLFPTGAPDFGGWENGRKEAAV